MGKNWSGEVDTFVKAHLDLFREAPDWTLAYAIPLDKVGEAHIQQAAFEE